MSQQTRRMRKRLSEIAERGRVRSGPPWAVSKEGPDGMFEVPGPCGERLTIIASAGSDLIPWEHVSVSTRKRNPNWREMCFVKELFWRDEECVVQYHPPKSEYINTHPHCLHMWRPVDGKFPLPPRIAV